ncbi:MAG: flagellar export chaperone FliS [Actinomycetales bacterium]
MSMPATAYGAYRNAYVNDAIETASPQRLLCMLYDRLVLDLMRAEAAIEQANREARNDALIHAQDIVVELLTSLDVTKWSGGARLASIYQFLLRELLDANVHADAGKVTSCRQIVEPLRDAWVEAAKQLAATA